MIVVDGLRKYFGEVKAIDGVGFKAEDGKITGLLGPNGAGKSTTLRILYTVLRPNAGSATVDGIDVVAQPLQARAHIGMDLFGPEPDFAAVARALGWYAEGPFEHGDDLAPALARAIAQVEAGKPALVDTVTRHR